MLTLLISCFVWTTSFDGCVSYVLVIYCFSKRLLMIWGQKLVTVVPLFYIVELLLG